ncbi:hypothetical protein CUMW_249450 [Citrus unshiu]|uniref:Uncharacterized protein n=1 Tax=Citrus unshiu TaxID=55188 RepID=A0A2H5QQI3_CITUN|nr:hypothetical protein CUMW_249450 [Citrus unshiu]
MSFGSEPFNPPKQMPKGSPSPAYTAGTLIPGNPPTARSVETAYPGVTNASSLFLVISF